LPFQDNNSIDSSELCCPYVDHKPFSVVALHLTIVLFVMGYLTQHSWCSVLLWAGQFGFQTPTGGKRFSLLHTHWHQPWGSSSLLYNEYWYSFLGVKQPEHSTDHLLKVSSQLVEFIHEMFLIKYQNNNITKTEA
jgi:hypothetical protein